jgi:hypothetical protein
MLGVGIEVLREHARVLESERALLMQTTMELQVLLSSFSSRLQIGAEGKNEAMSRRPYATQHSGLQVICMQLCC